MESNINNFEDQLTDLLRDERFNSEEPADGHLERFFDKVGEGDCFAYARNDGGATDRNDETADVIARERSDRGNLDGGATDRNDETADVIARERSDRGNLDGGEPDRNDKTADVIARERSDRGNLDGGEPDRNESRREIRFRRNTTTRRGFGFWKAICFPVAASIALVFIANILMKGLEQNRDFFSSLGPDADAYDVYESYMEQVGSAYRFLSENSMDIKEELHDEIFSMLENITDEAIPLIETLPSEMGDDEKAAVAKIYYTERLKGVSSFKNYVSEYVNNR